MKTAATKGRLKILIECAKGAKGLFALAIASIAIAALFYLADPLILRFTLDGVLAGKEADAPGWLLGLARAVGGPGWLARNLWACAIAIAITGSLNALFGFFRGALASRAAERTTEALRNRLFGKIAELPYAYFGRASAGDLIQRCGSDVETVRRFLSTQFVDIGKALALMCFSVLAMLSIDSGMTLVALPIVPAIFAFSYLFFRRIQKAFKASDEAEGEMTQVLAENLQGIRVVRAFARGPYEEARFDAKNAAYTGVTVRLIDLFGTYWAVSGLICMVQTAVVLAVGSARAASGQISVGTLAAFFAYVGRLHWPVRQLGRTLTDLGKAMVSMGRIAEILGLRSEFETDGFLKPATAGRVEFDRVSFSYDSGHPVLKELSFTVEPGQTLAILGKTGSGKSTIAHLLARLVEPDSGEIRIDGRRIAEMDKRRLRGLVGVVLQEPFLFSMSLRENLELGAGSLPDGEADALAETAGLAKTVRSFEKGWETAVGEEGVTLSGGQRQRVAIARMLAKRPSVLVLDDSLSAVDTETDAAIRAALDEGYPDGTRPTRIIVAHRLTTLAGADRIVVLEDGRAADSGTHEELIGRPGLYRRVWEIQRGIEEAYGALDGPKSLPAAATSRFAAAPLE